MALNTRSALILYSKIYTETKEEKIHILIGMGDKGLTSIGGRREQNDKTDIDCLIREVKEETRGILDYSLIPETFSNKEECEKVSYQSCLYAFLQTSHEKLLKIKDIFQNKEAGRSVEMELSSLIVADINDLLIDIIKKRNNYQFNPVFKDMFLNMGFDELKNIRWNYLSEKLNSNDYTLSPNFDFEDIPQYVSLRLSKIPGIDHFGTCKIKDQIYYIYRQYYGQINGEHIFG